MTNKSKLPDLNEVTKFATKFYNDMKKSVCEIFSEYKDARETSKKTSSNNDIISSKEKEPKPKKTAPKTKKTD